MRLVDLDNSWGEGILQDWYIHSVNPDDPPQWTDEHIEELCKDFYVIPKETTKYDIDCNFDRLQELAEADKEGRCLVLPCKVGELPDEDIAIPEIQILKKPAKCKVGYCQSNSAGYSYVLETKYHCPTCGVVVSEYTDFCPLCRQLLEWNKEEEDE